MPVRTRSLVGRTRAAVSGGNLKRLRRKIRATQREIAAIRDPRGKREDDMILTAMSEIEAVIAATRDAADALIGAAERLDALSGELRGSAPGEVPVGIRERMTGISIAILERCTFQDIAGQRLAKALKAVGEIDRCVAAVIEVWGAGRFQRLRAHVGVGSPEDKLLSGPAAEGRGMRQSQVDEFFR